MDCDELECFMVLATELHFGRTAERMRLSRARVSQLVQRLERRIGAPLFARTSRRVSLTTLGRRLRDDLEPHQRGIKAAMARAMASAKGIDEVLLVGFTNPLTGEVVVKAAEAMRTRHPEIAVEICEVPFNDPFSLLRKGEFDVQLSPFPVRESDLGEGPVLLSERRSLAVHTGHELSKRDEISPEDLAGVELIDLEGEPPGYWRDFHSPARTPSGRAIPRGPLVANHQEALTLVGAGKGALLSAAHAAVYHPRPTVAYVPLDAEPVGYGLVWRAGDENRAVRAFAETALDVVSAD
ncbi:LysR family transcriptional regulator [Phytomonospora sp. NPDC050363]|uniref:LysR family transcriptional regulator n=1 Tax=Phytomonospora sp. NPDC050363 TaxID=3155642 RepID=UPI0033EFF84B